MPTAIIASILAGAILSALLVGITFLLLVGQAIGRRRRSLESFARVVLAPGAMLSEENAFVRLSASWLAWTVIAAIAIFVAWSLAR
jgi:hypothetical protein